MNNSLEYLVAYDFLSKFEKTKDIYKSSPLASSVALECLKVYPSVSREPHLVKNEHLIAAAKAHEVLFQFLPNGDAKLGIDANQFKRFKSRAAYSQNFICVHGFAPITFIQNNLAELPSMVACCKRCRLGQVLPTQADIDAAIAFLQQRLGAKEPPSGALILGAQQLGYIVIPRLDGKFSLRKPGLSKKTEDEKLEILNLSGGTS